MQEWIISEDNMKWLNLTDSNVMLKYKMGCFINVFFPDLSSSFQVVYGSERPVTEAALVCLSPQWRLCNTCHHYLLISPRFSKSPHSTSTHKDEWTGWHGGSKRKRTKNYFRIRCWPDPSGRVCNWRAHIYREENKSAAGCNQSVPC